MRNRFQLSAVVPMTRGALSVLEAAEEPGLTMSAMADEVTRTMNARAAERNRRVLDSPWLERVEEDFDGDEDLVALVFYAQTEPA